MNLHKPLNDSRLRQPSRRTFVKGLGVGAAAAGLGLWRDTPGLKATRRQRGEHSPDLILICTLAKPR
jgi:hypothetical protein